MLDKVALADVLFKLSPTYEIVVLPINLTITLGPRGIYRKQIFKTKSQGSWSMKIWTYVELQLQILLYPPKEIAEARGVQCWEVQLKSGVFSGWIVDNRGPFPHKVGCRTAELKAKEIFGKLVYFKIIMDAQEKVTTKMF
jgi:hypothetical protein